jgi:pyruvate,water dikinase
MFSLGEKTGSRSKKELQTDIPLKVHILNVGDGLCVEAEERDSVALDDICCQPFLALWKGLSHPGVDWQSHNHFDWKRSDEIALAGGFVWKNSGELGSYAIMGRDYLNFNIRFGYHFTLVDTLCGKDSRMNFCQLRFAGGGGAYVGRFLRLEFLDIVLKRLGFEVSVKADLLDARLTEMDEDELCAVLDLLGRLLGAVKLLDLVLRQEEDVERYVELFFGGQYTFTKPSA